MSSAHFLALDAPASAEEVSDFLPLLDDALSGTGKAILPLPREAGEHRTRLIERAGTDEPLEDADTALLVPTSGSGGVPKIALLSRHALIASAKATHDALGGPGRWLLCLPTSHVAGLQVLTRSLVAGFPPVTVDLREGFRPEALLEPVSRLLDDIGPEPRYAALVPTQLHRVLETGGAVVSALVALDAVLLGGSAPPPHLVDRAHAEGITLVQTYGMTETCGGCVYDGVPLSGVHVDVDEGRRIQIRGPILFSAYRNDPAGTAEHLHNDTFTTSDLGHFDEQKRLVVDGRVDDVVVTGGVNVSCAEVQRVLSRHPDVLDVVVVGIDDDEWGEEVVAVAVTDAPVSLGTLRSFAGRHLRPEELPRRLVLVDEIPQLATGKPDVGSVRQLVSQDRTRSSQDPSSR